MKKVKVLDLTLELLEISKCQRLISLLITHFKEHIQNCYMNKITDCFNIVFYKIYMMKHFTLVHILVPCSFLHGFFP